jgi:hypothetical protein
VQCAKKRLKISRAESTNSFISARFVETTKES